MAKPAKKTNRSNCDVTAGRVDLSKYEKLDGYWKELGLAAPARRALVNNKVLKTTDLKKFTERDRKSTRLNSSHIPLSRMPSSA